jgi:hypothetical protein
MITVEYLRTSFATDFLACVPLILTQERVLWLYPFKILRIIRISQIVTLLQQWSQLLKERYQRY